MHKQLNYNLVWQVPSYSLGQSLGYGDNKTGSLWANCVQMGPSCTDVRGGGVLCWVSKSTDVCLLSPPRAARFVLLLLGPDMLWSAQRADIYSHILQH